MSYLLTIRINPRCINSLLLFFLLLLILSASVTVNAQNLEIGHRPGIGTYNEEPISLLVSDVVFDENKHRVYPVMCMRLGTNVATNMFFGFGLLGGVQCRYRIAKKLEGRSALRAGAYAGIKGGITRYIDGGTHAAIELSTGIFVNQIMSVDVIYEQGTYLSGQVNIGSAGSFQLGFTFRFDE